MYELRKIWNWRVLALIVALTVLVWFSLLSEWVRSYESLNTHGGFGSYQREMFDRYGATLEPDELVDFDIPGRKAAVVAELDNRIAEEPLFADYGIRNYAEFINFSETKTMEEAEGLMDVFLQMNNLLTLNDSNEDGEQTLDEYYASPQIRLQTLKAVESTFVDYEDFLNSYIEHDERPVLVRSVNQIVDVRNHSLIRDNLGVDVSAYATVVCIFSITATLLLVAPPLANDRMRKMNLIQYASSIGRRILFVQWSAMMLSACILSLALMTLSLLPLMWAGVGDYWNVSMLSWRMMHITLYDITFGQFAFWLAGMIIALNAGTACFTFLLARFSANLMNLLIKIVPAGLALSGLAAITVNMAFSSNNILFSNILRGRVEKPEPLLCALIAGAGVVTALIIARREKKTDTA